MIDIEAEVFDAVATAVLALEPDAFVTSEYVQAPAAFPAVSCWELTSLTDTRRIDSTKMERASVVTYEVNVYSNLKTGAKRQAKALVQAADRVMLSLNFNRTFLQRTDNQASSGIYRITARYTASVDYTNTIYRR